MHPRPEIEPDIQGHLKYVYQCIYNQNYRNAQHFDLTNLEDDFKKATNHFLLVA